MTDVTDNFNRASLGTNWTNTMNSLDTVSSTVVHGTTSSDNVAYWNANSFASNHYSEVVLPSIQQDGGPVIRHTTVGVNFYLFDVDAVDTTSNITMFLHDGTGFHQLGTNANGTFAINDVIRLDGTGSTLTATQNSIQILQKTDSTLSGGQPGIHCFNTNMQWDNWVGGPISGGTAWTDNATLAGVGTTSPTVALRAVGQSTLTGAGRISGPAATFDPTFVNANVTLDVSNLVVTGVSATANTSARSTVAYSAGKFFCEFSANNIASQSGVGICNATQGVGTSIAASLNAIGYMADGTVKINSVTVSTLTSFVTGDIIDMAVDFDNNSIWFRKNNGTWNNSGTANPGGNVGGISLSTLNAGPYFAAVEVVGTDKITAAFHG